MISMFNVLDDQLYTFNALFADVLDNHAPIKRIKIKTRPNFFITEEIRQLMKTRDLWHRRAIRLNDRLHWNAHRCFKQEVKCELRFAEKLMCQPNCLIVKGTPCNLEDYQQLPAKEKSKS